MNEKINFIDVGCDNNRYCNKKYHFVGEPWFTNKQYINFILGFDLQLTYFYKKQIRKSGIEHKLCKKGVFSSKCKKKFYKVRKRDCSSFYKPNMSVITENVIKIKKHKYEVISTKSVRCVRIDSIIDKIGMDFDFVKIDAHGSEYEVIKSIGNYIDSQIVGILVEVYFTEKYKNIYLAEEIFKLLKKHNFYSYMKIGKVDYLFIKDSESKKQKINFIKKIYRESNNENWVLC